MELRNLGIIYNKVPNFMNYTDGKIIDLFLIYDNNEAFFAANIDFVDSNGKKKTGLFNIDIINNKLNFLCKKDCIKYLEYLDIVLNKNIFSKIKQYIEKCKNDKELIEYNNYFVFLNKNSVTNKANAESTITFNDNQKTIKNNLCILHCSSGLNTNYVKINDTLINKSDFINIDYSTKVELKIQLEDKDYTDFGNIKSTTKSDCELSFLIESLEASLLSKNLLDNLNFNKISPGEIINVILNTTKTARIGKIDATNNLKRKFKYITILNNYEIEDDELFIGDLVFSKKIKEVDISRIKPTSSKYTYVSIYIIANNISDAKNEAIKKINNIKNFIELIEKNSSIYQMYNKGNTLTNWDIDRLFIDYELSNQFYIYNILDSSQFVCGSNNNTPIKNHGLLTNESEILKYKNQIEKIIYNYGDKENKLFNAMFWLNKSLESINRDLYHSIIYLNIAIEYATNNEKCPTLEEDYPELKDIFTEIKNLINNKNLEQKTKDIVNNKLNSVINDNSINKRFYSMLKRLNIEFSEKHLENYRNIRKARNDIIHNNSEIDITQHNIIDCYILVSKVIFYKITEGQNEYI